MAPILQFKFMAIERVGLGEPEVSEEVSEEVVTIPKSILGGREVAVGDVVRLRVTDIDDNPDGVLSAKYATEEAEAKPTKGVSAMASEFD